MRRSTLPAVLLVLCLGAPLAVGTSTATAAPSTDRRAEAAVRQAPHEVALDDRDGLVTRDVITDPDGTTHVRFDRTRSGLPVLGGDMVVHQSADGRLRGVSATARQPLHVSTTPSISAQQAERAAERAAPYVVSSVQRAKLQIEAGTPAPLLVWSVLVLGTQPDGTPSELATLVDARNGEVVVQIEQIETVGDDTGRHVGTVDVSTTAVAGGFELRDSTRGGQHTTDMQNGTSGNGVLFTSSDDAWGGTVPTEDVAVDAHYGATQTLDYFKLAHKRNGIDDAGYTGFSRVHYGALYNNAFWSAACRCMTYGDGDGTTFNPFTALDVAGHEMAHGITQATANLTYSGESGGLNEATSDIFGSMVEHFSNSAESTSPLLVNVDTPDYLIGEKLRPSGQPLRNMAHPSLDGRSVDCWSRQVKNLGVHYSSGVGNHFFYLLANGSAGTGVDPSPTCDGSVITGIGKDLAAQIWYRALTVYMNSRTDYAAARTATLNAARDLMATGAPSDTGDRVAAAWTAVGVKASGGGGKVSK